MNGECSSLLLKRSGRGEQGPFEYCVNAFTRGDVRVVESRQKLEQGKERGRDEGIGVNGCKGAHAGDTWACWSLGWVEGGVGWGGEEQSQKGVDNRFLPCFPAALPSALLSQPS